MKGLLKVYHPDETLKYNLKHTYCKAVYSNKQHFLDVEIETDDSLDHVDDDSLQYNFPQLCFEISEFPLDSEVLTGKTFLISDTDEEAYTEVDLFGDEEAFLYDSELTFTNDEKDGLQLVWKGHIDDFYTGADEPILFKLKCHFQEEELDLEE